MATSELPYELEFMHKYNLHKWLGLLIEDDDLAAIARLYGVPLRRLRAVDRAQRRHVAQLAAQLAVERPRRDIGQGFTLLALGDSITSDRESYAKILAEYWKDGPGGRVQHRVLDGGISGDTTSHLVTRFYSTVLNQEFEWVVLFIGTNDCRQLDDPAGISTLSLEEYQRNLRYLSGRLRERGKQLVHVTLPPADSRRLREFLPDANWLYDPKRLEATNEFIRRLARETRSAVADLAAAIAAQGEDVLEPDGLHLSSTGHLLLCRLLLDILP